MRFTEGEVVVHKLTEREYIILKGYPIGLFRRSPYYCVENDNADELYVYECVLEAKK